MKLTKAMCEEQFARLTIEEQRWIICVVEELQAARTKHPAWPKDVIHGIAILNEESGEAMKEALQFTYENGRFFQMHREVIQTGAMALRFLIETGDDPKKVKKFTRV
jgi:hypothetical protein